jgi:hypothetical protein
MTKKVQILRLAKLGKTTREIATKVMGLAPDASRDEADAKMAYVRVVIRQRKGGTYSAADKAWLMRTYGGATVQEAQRNKSRIRYADPTSRERELAYMKTSYYRRKAALAARQRPTSRRSHAQSVEAA